MKEGVTFIELFEMEDMAIVIFLVHLLDLTKSMKVRGSQVEP